MKKLLIAILCGAAGIAGARAQSVLTTTPKGARYQVLKQGGGQHVKMGDVITFQFIQKTDKDSVLDSSYKRGTPAQTQVKESVNAADLMEVFQLMSVNDSVLVKVPTDSIFARAEQQRPPFLPKGSNLNFIIKMEKTQTIAEIMAEREAATAKMAAEETAAIAKYITTKNLQPVTTASGLKYIITQPSAKRKPLNGETVLVNYAGRTLDGKLFDSSIASVAQEGGLQQPGRNYEPIEVAVGQGRVIPGWDEGLLLLGEGAKATFIIPSKLGYGASGTPDGSIPPFAPLAFDVEIVKVIPAPNKPAATSSVRKKPAAKKATARKPAVKKKVTPK